MEITRLVAESLPDADLENFLNAQLTNACVDAGFRPKQEQLCTIADMVKNVCKYSPTNLMLAAHTHYDNLCKVLLKGQE